MTYRAPRNEGTSRATDSTQYQPTDSEWAQAEQGVP